MILRKFLALAGVSSLLLAAALVALETAPLAAQEVVQDEGAAYREWHAATQANDIPKAAEAANAYLAKYPTGQYVEVIKNWLPSARLALLDAAIKERRTADMIKIGREVLAPAPENLNVLYALAFNLRRNELLASPASFEHAADAVEFAKKAITLIEGGQTMANVQNFDKNDTLGWLTQILAMAANQAGNLQEAVSLYEKSTTLAPGNPQVAGRNLLTLYNLQQTAYGEALKAYKALAETATPTTTQPAAEPTPEVKAAIDKVNQESDALVDRAAAFVAFATAKNFAASTRDRVNQTLEAVYKGRHPEDATLEGLRKLLQDKTAALGLAAAPAAPVS